MTFSELKRICDPVKVTGPEPNTLGALTQDSRKVEPNDVFVAVKGTQVDGHRFIDDAIENGAAVIIYQDSFYTEADVCAIQVENTRALLGPLAQAFAGNPAKELTIIGITGTNGKTTVATLTYQALQSLGARPSLLGTVAKRIDDEVLDSLLTTSDPIELARDMRRMVNAESTHLVMEVSSHALDQQRVNGIDFKVAAFTNLSHDHLDYHPSVEAYASTKKQLFDGLNEDATAVINGDDEQAAYMIEDCAAESMLFSFEKADMISCAVIESDSTGLQLSVDDTEIKSSMVGRFNAYNVAQTFLICRALEFSDANIAKALGPAAGAAGRLQRVQLADQENQPLVLVDYAHTPGALENCASIFIKNERRASKTACNFWLWR